MFWHFDRSTGALSPEQIIPSVPPGFTGTDFTSEIRVSSDGDFVYGANRLNDTISVFEIGHDGSLTQRSHVSTLGDYPRIFSIDPSGRFLAVGNQFADNVTTFRINQGHDREDDDRKDDDRKDNDHDDDHDDDDRKKGEAGRDRRGSLSFTGNYTPVGSPSGMVYLI